MRQVATETAVTSADLLRRIRSREGLFILDVRPHEQFERFAVEGPGVTTLNFPYSKMLECGGQNDAVDSVAACVERDLATQLPKSSPIVAVCAKGKTSQSVLQGLLRLGYQAESLQGGMQAWGDYYDAQPVIDTPGLAIFQISRPGRGCLSYLIASGSQAIVIDPLRHLHSYLDLVRSRGLKVTAIIDTHSHADHISGGRALAAETGAPYHLHPYDAIHPMDMLPATFAYEPMRDKQIFHAGSHELRVIHTPGHTLGLVALLLDDQYLFSGDSIFIRSIARPDLGGKAEAWAPLHTQSLRKLMNLPDQIQVMPGHFSSLEESDDSGLAMAPIGKLKQSNDALSRLQRNSDAEFVRYLLESLPKSVPEYVEIKRVNTGLVSPSEEDAAKLELGKNVCGLAQGQAAAHADAR